MNWKNIFNWHKKSDDKEPPYPLVELGCKLPWPQYHKTGDYSTVMIVPKGISIIISLTNLSEQEIKAIGDDAFDMYLCPIECIPFLVLKFGDVFKTDLTINVMKVYTEQQLADWLNCNEKTIELYLLEGSDATLKCIRYFDYPHMDMVRKICKHQQNYTAVNIDNTIQYVYEKISVDGLIANSRCIDFVPAVEYHL